MLPKYILPSSIVVCSRLLPLTSAFHAAATHKPIIKTQLMSTWDNFSYDDDDELLDSGVDADFLAADENDDPVVKAMAGMALDAPEVYWDGEPIEVPVGSQLELSEENVQGVLAACRQEIGTMFGYQAENRGVGITGGVDFVDLDGPTGKSKDVTAYLPFFCFCDKMIHLKFLFIRLKSWFI